MWHVLDTQHACGNMPPKAMHAAIGVLHVMLGETVAIVEEMVVCVRVCVCWWWR